MLFSGFEQLPVLNFLEEDCSNWKLMDTSNKQNCYFYTESVRILIVLVRHYGRPIIRIFYNRRFQVKGKYHCTAHDLVYHCRPDQGQNRKLKINRRIQYSYTKHGYGYWTTDVKGEIKIVKGKPGEVNKIRSVSKELYEQFDQCKPALREKANAFFPDLREKACMGIEKVQDMNKKSYT